MLDKKNSNTFQDFLQALTRYLKFWKVILLLAALGLALAASYFTYCKPGYYSRSLISYNDVFNPVTSETSDVFGNTRYSRLGFVLQSALRSRWLVERTAYRLGLIEEPGQFEYIRQNFVSKVDVSFLPGEIIQLEVFAYYPWLVREWPEAMLETYRDYTLRRRAQHWNNAVQAYTKEMESLKSEIESERDAAAKFEEENQLIERYVSMNSLASIPSEMLTIKTRLDSIGNVLAIVQKDSLTPIEKLAILKRFRGSSVPLGSIVRSDASDSVSNINRPSPVDVATILGNSVTASPVAGNSPSPANNGTSNQMVVIPSMINPLEPWEIREQELRAAEQKLKQLSQHLLPGHEKMRELNALINSLEASIRSHLDTSIASFQLERSHLQERFEELQKDMPTYRKVLNDYNHFKQQYALTTSGQIAWQNAYTGLKARLNLMDYTGIDTKLQLEFQGFTMMRDKEPYSPNKKTLFAYGLALGLCLAGGVSFGLEKYRATTSLVSDAERVTGLHALGVLPLSESKEDFERIFRDQQSEHNDGYDVRESFRIVRCSIPLHVNSNNRCQVIMVTSARPDEGKTVISSLLARSFADAGQKTLLIDADLRRGRISDLLEGKLTAGLRGWLDSDIAELEDVIVKAPGDNLYVIPRGGYSSSAIEGLGGKLISGVAELRQKFDKIIIDTPPVLGLADSLMVAPYVDGAVFVIRAGRTSQRDIITGLEQIKATNVPMYGFLLNQVDLNKVENYYYYASYYPKYYDPTYLETVRG